MATALFRPEGVCPENRIFIIGKPLFFFRNLAIKLPGIQPPLCNRNDFSYHRKL
jgi:hypothetical protein